MKLEPLVASVMSNLKKHKGYKNLGESEIADIKAGVIETLKDSVSEVAADMPFVAKNEFIFEQEISVLQVTVKKINLVDRPFYIVEANRPYADITGDTVSGGVWGRFYGLIDAETDKYVAGLGIDSPQHLSKSKRLPAEFYKNVVEGLFGVLDDFNGEEDLTDEQFKKAYSEAVIDNEGFQFLSFALSDLMSSDAIVSIRAQTDAFFTRLEETYGSLIDVFSMRSGNILYCHSGTAEKYISTFAQRCEALVANATELMKKVIDDYQVKAEVGESWGSW